MARRFRFRLSQPGSLYDLMALGEPGPVSVALLDGVTAEHTLLSMNLRYEWRGFSFGSFWFGYYFTLGSAPSPRLGGRWAM